MLSDTQLDALADRLAPRLAALLDEARCAATTPTSMPPAGTLVDAKVVAAALAIDRKTVYRRKHELGGVQVGSRWRFDLAKALAGAAAEVAHRSPSERSEPSSKPATPRRRRTRKGSATTGHCQLLPVGRVSDRGEAR